MSLWLTFLQISGGAKKFEGQWSMIGLNWSQSKNILISPYKELIKLCSQDNF